jgi:hypothetical protein
MPPDLIGFMKRGRDTEKGICAIADHQEAIEQWQDHYNYIRPHSALGYENPAPEARVPWPPLREAAMGVGPMAFKLT